MKKTTETNNKKIILAAAQELFLSRGYHGTSIRNIAQQAKVSLGGIYALFANKEKIYEELLFTRIPFLALADIAKKHAEKNTADFFKHVAKDWHQSLNPSDFRLLLIDWVEFQGKTIKKLLPKLLPKNINYIKAVIKARVANKDLKPYDPFLIFRAFVQMLTLYFITDDFLDGFGEIKKPIDDLVEIYLHGVLR